MAEKSSYLANDAQLDATVAVSYSTKAAVATDQAHPNVSYGHVLNLDVIFIILSFLPTEDVLQLKTVCRTWAQLISDPVFIRAHSSRPVPITSFFTEQVQTPHHVFTPLPTSPKSPSMITVLLSSGFMAACTSHGLVCFRKDGVIIIANPATSHWALIPRRVFPCRSPDDSTHSHVLIYDPEVSLHFKLAIASCKMFSDNQLRFRIYSSERSAWMLSSVCPFENEFLRGKVLDLDTCKGSKIGGGSVCWMGSFQSHDCLSGYEIASDTYWMTPLPCFKDDIDERDYIDTELMVRDGEIYFASFDDKKKEVKVGRLDEDKRWVWEGECDTREFEELTSAVIFHASYDCVRKALILNVYGRDEMVALHLTSSRVEVLSQEKFNYMDIKLPHANTLAPFHGGKRRNAHAIDKLGSTSSSKRPTILFVFYFLLFLCFLFLYW